MPTPQKTETIGELRALLENSQLAVVADYRGLTVAQLGQLRRNLRGKAVLHITKNTLLHRAAAEANLPQLSELLGGPTAVAFVKDDIAGAIQTLNEFVRTSRILTLRGALFGPSIVPAGKVADLANIPSRPQLYGQIVGSVQGPLNNLVSTLNQLFSQVVYALQAYSDKQTEAAAPAEAPAEAPSTETPAEPPTAEPPAEAPTAEAPKTEPPTVEAHVAELPAETPAAEAPTAEAPAEPLSVEAPITEPPSVEEPVAEPPAEEPAVAPPAETETPDPITES
ncbi:MAG: 50S ribosomal protein L10 [Chloroflexia bacterium]